jgi:hypothetical protein
LCSINWRILVNRSVNESNRSPFADFAEEERKTLESWR